MHFYNLKFYCFIDKYDKLLINNLKSNVSIIYRNYSPKCHLETIKKIKEICKKKGLKFYLSNNIKLAISLNLDGAYIPSFNKDLALNSFSFKKILNYWDLLTPLNKLELKKNRT